MLFETILGGITGLLGNVVTSIFNYKSAKLEIDRAKQQNEFNLKMVDAETRAMIMEAKANIRVTQAQVEGAIDIKDAEAFMQSQTLGNQQFFGNEWIKGLLQIEGKWKIITLPCAVFVSILFGFVDFLRGLMRPTLTAYLTFITTWVTWQAWQIMQTHGLSITSDQAVQIFNETTSIVTYLTVSCVTWWFGDRRMAKTIMQLRGAKTTNLGDDIKIE